MPTCIKLFSVDMTPPNGVTRQCQPELLYNADAVSVVIGCKHTVNSGWHSLVSSYLQTVDFMHVRVTSYLQTIVLCM